MLRTIPIEKEIAEELLQSAEAGLYLHMGEDGLWYLTSQPTPALKDGAAITAHMAHRHGEYFVLVKKPVAKLLELNESAHFVRAGGSALLVVEGEPTERLKTSIYYHRLAYETTPPRILVELFNLSRGVALMWFQQEGKWYATLAPPGGCNESALCKQAHITHFSQNFPTKAFLPKSVENEIKARGREPVAALWHVINHRLFVEVVER